MCQNLDLRFLFFYCLFMLIFFSFYSPFFAFSVFQFLLPFLPFSVFLLPFFPPPPLLFHLCFCLFFLLLWVSSLSYLNLLGTKRLGGGGCCYLAAYQEMLNVITVKRILTCHGRRETINEHNCDLSID
jgi:hypothetical protein